MQQFFRRLTAFNSKVRKFFCSSTAIFFCCGQKAKKLLALLAIQINFNFQLPSSATERSSCARVGFLRSLREGSVLTRASHDFVDGCGAARSRAQLLRSCHHASPVSSRATHRLRSDSLSLVCRVPAGVHRAEPLHTGSPRVVHACFARLRRWWRKPPETRGECTRFQY